MAGKSKKLAMGSIESTEALVEPMVPPFFPTLSFEDLADLSRDNIAAVTKANLALSEGLQAISRELLGYAKSTFESAGQTATALLGAKTLDEVIQLNSELAKTSMEALLSRSAKLSEMSVSVASEAFAPLGGRVEAAFARLTKPVAA